MRFNALNPPSGEHDQLFKEPLLDPARTRLLGVFIDRYPALTAEEMKVFEREMAGFAPEERQKTMELLMDIEIKAREQGIEQGLHEGKEEMAMRLIRKRFGTASNDVSGRQADLSAMQLDELGEALFDFAAVSDLEQWLGQRSR